MEKSVIFFFVFFPQYKSSCVQQWLILTFTAQLFGVSRATVYMCSTSFAKKNKGRNWGQTCVDQ